MPHNIALEQIKKYYVEGLGDINTLRRWLVPNSSTKEAEKNTESESSLYGHFRDSDLRTTPKPLVSFLENAIKSKFYFPDSVNKEENYRKGNRINRGFMNGTSYKPLVGKTKVAHKKKKIMIVIDGSGSMDDYGK